MEEVCHHEADHDHVSVDEEELRGVGDDHGDPALWLCDHFQLHVVVVTCDDFVQERNDHGSW